MTITSKISRRDFLKVSSAAGAGLVLGFYLPYRDRLLAAETDSPLDFEPNAWLKIDTDGTTTIMVAKSEMGQGVMTSLPMIVAEELDIDWATVQMVQAPAHPKKYGSQNTSGSRSVRTSWEILRKAGATGRMMLIMAAAKKWNVGIKSCYSDKGTVVHRPSGRRFTYGELVNTASKIPIPSNVSLKNPDDFRIIGKSLPRIDTPSKVNGSALYCNDVKLPDMHYATVSRCPVFGGTVKHFNADATLQSNDVVDVFEIDRGVVVLAKSTWAAIKGKRLLNVTWDEGTNRDLSSKKITQLFNKRSEKKGAVGRKDGNVEKALELSHSTLQASYEVTFQAHATMEPMSCVADVRQDGCEIWVPTQGPQSAQKVVSKLTGFPLDKIKVNVTLLGGGFGRRAFNDFVIEAVQISKKAGKPVKLIWTREDDIHHDYYRPASKHILQGGFDNNKRLIAWSHRIIAPSIIFSEYITFPIPFKEKLDRVALHGAKDLPYTIPNILIDYKMANTAIPVGWWRSVYHSQNAFANECFLDELAESAGEDPFEFRFKLLSNSLRHANVLKLAANKSGWGNPLPQGHYQGISCHESFGSFVAQVAEISINEEEGVKVHRVVCAIDCGQVINPDTVEAQVESSIAYGLTATIKSKITIKNGRVRQSNFHNFKILRIDEMPQIDVHIVSSTESPGGVGEPGLPPIAPAVANAVFAATGKRIRKLPILPKDLKTI
ncbi:MAG: xanthine dehydrogenase family protein molybdopterin-binding subunit [Candidatus Marinimicrobia bacterium]|nr:xanthine dehydrogenase family protein molybdopterin-binding subunit [Candidatus Neomarinimicrobiota bacterium]